MRDDQRVSLYQLERRLGAHRDLLQSLCAYEGIAVDRPGGIRCIAEPSVLQLAEAVALWRERPRPYARRRRPA